MIFLITFIFTVAVQAQPAASFRNNATGGAIDDNLDYIFDPVNLFRVEGVRLYTNLSNLTSTNEEVFNAVSDGEFLMGVSSRLPFLEQWWVSGMLQSRNTETPQWVSIDSDLDGFWNIDGNGELEDIYTEHLDTDGDGLYNTLTTTHQTVQDFDTQNNRGFLINNTFRFDELTLGARYNRRTTEASDTRASSNLGSGTVFNPVAPGDPSYTRELDLVLLPEGDTDWSWGDNGDFSWNNVQRESEFTLAAMLPFLDNHEARVDFSFHGEEDLLEINDSYEANRADFDRENPDHFDNYEEMDQYTSIEEVKGSEMRIGGSIRHTFAEEDDAVNDGYWQAGGNLGFGSYDYTQSTSSPFSSSENFFDGDDTPANDYATTADNNVYIDDNGTRDSFSSSLFLRYNRPLTSQVQFGGAVRLINTRITTETDYVERMVSITSFNQNDNIDDANDIVTTHTENMTADHTCEDFITTVVVPVGVSWRYGKKKNWEMRLGARFQQQSVVQNESFQVTDSDPFTTTTEFGDGEVTVNLSDNTFQSTSSQSRRTTSNTLFSYGLGYYPTSNLQIDLLGFLGMTAGSQIIDADFYRCLRLSVSLNLD